MAIRNDPLNKIKVPEIGEEAGVTLITCTRDCPEAFRLCESWISRQSFKGQIQWIVVDDGILTIKPTLNQDYIRKEPRPRIDTFRAKLREALQQAKHQKILFIGDTYWYAPDYVQTLSDLLDSTRLVSLGTNRTYALRSRSYQEDQTQLDLFSSGVSGLKKQLWDASLSDEPLAKYLWETVVGKRCDELNLSVRFTGFNGGSHATETESKLDDSQCSALYAWIAEDLDSYKPFIVKYPLSENLRILVYTVLIGSYDQLRPPTVVNHNVDYIAITDAKEVPSPWKKIEIGATVVDPVLESRFLKINGKPEFKDYDWVIYHDAQFQLTVDPCQLVAECDGWDKSDVYLFRHSERNCIYQEIKEFAENGKIDTPSLGDYLGYYKAKGINPDTGLLLGKLFIRRTDASDFRKRWWSEYTTGIQNDQVNVTVAAGATDDRISMFPTNWWNNFFVKHSHEKTVRAFSKQLSQTVLVQNPADPERQSIAATVSDFARNSAKYGIAKARWVVAGCPIVPKVESDLRLEICRTCEHLQGKNCGLCNCYLLEKAEMATEHCPELRWDDPARREQALSTINENEPGGPLPNHPPFVDAKE